MAHKRKLSDAPDAPSRVVPPPTERERDTLAELRALLDLSALSATKDIATRFADIAELLLNDVVLRLHTPDGGAVDYEILEAEFYLVKARCHEDPFTHGTEEQRRSGRWYFHRAPRRNGNTDPTDSVASRTPTAAGGYRGGTRKGLDLTFGGPVGSSVATETATTSRFFASDSSASDTLSTTAQTLTETEDEGARRGGILLRTLRRTTDRTLLSGPSLLVDEILRASGASNIAALVRDVWADALDAFPHPSSSSSTPQPSMHLHPSTPRGEKVYASPRIGLDLSRAQSAEDTRVAFVGRRYRFFVHPAQLTANGRGQTFLGVYNSLVPTNPDEKDEEMDESELARRLTDLTGLKHLTALKYLDEYRGGARASLRTFLGAAGKGAGSSPVPFLRMMGCLDRQNTSSE